MAGSCKANFQRLLEVQVINTRAKHPAELPLLEICLERKRPTEVAQALSCCGSSPFLPGTEEGMESRYLACNS